LCVSTFEFLLSENCLKNAIFVKNANFDKKGSVYKEFGLKIKNFHRMFIPIDRADYVKQKS